VDASYQSGSIGTPLASALTAIRVEDSLYLDISRYSTYPSISVDNEAVSRG
jgi:hypothetical protein